MGIPLRFLNPRNYRDMLLITKISANLNRHMRKRCGYCDFDLGSGDVEVVVFVAHLEEKHADKIDPKDLETYKKMIKKVTR